MDIYGDSGQTESERLENSMKEHIAERIGSADDVTDLRLYEYIDEELARESESRYIALQDKIRLRESLFNAFRRLDILQELLDDDGITEIMINGPEDIFIERKTGIQRLRRSFQSREKLEDIIQQIVGRINRSVNTSEPIVDAMLRDDGSRVHIVLPPIALNGPIVTIRKFPERIGMERMIRGGTVSREAAEFLGRLVRCGYNIFISGGTASGKSTFLNALCEYIPSEERIITIEDSAELRIKGIPNMVRMETRNKNSTGEGEINMSMLIKAALRMRPDRLIIGEVRGAEAADMLTAGNTGHDGMLSTGHANSTEDMLNRFESMVLMGMDIPMDSIRNRIVSAIDILVHLRRMPDGSRRVTEISEVGEHKAGRIELNRIYDYDTQKRSLKRIGELKRTQKLEIKGG